MKEELRTIVEGVSSKLAAMNLAREYLQSRILLLMQEAGAETFKALASIAHATGGYAASSSNPESLFRSALETAENYYLLYYTPKNYTGDGGFKYLRVNVKCKDCKVTHRMGYFAD